MQADLVAVHTAAQISLQGANSMAALAALQGLTTEVNPEMPSSTEHPCRKPNS